MKHFLGNPQPLRPKRKRLSHACNYCRLKKIRCDDAQPGCGACQAAGIDCITSTRQQPVDPSLSQRTAEKDVLEESQGQQFNPRVSSQSREIDISPRAGTCGTIQGVPILQELSRLSPLNSKPANKVSSLNEPDGDDYLPLIPSTLPEAGTARIATQWLRIAFNRLKLYPPRDWIEFEKDAVSQRISLEPFFGNPGPALPNADEIRAHTARFVADVLVIYPLISTSLVRRLLDQITSIPLKITSVRVQDPSVLAFGYLVSIVGMKLQPKSSPQQLLIERYLGHCTSLLGHLLAERSVTSLQMVLLLAIILRVCDRLDLSWDVLMVALTMAKSLNCDRNCALLVTGEESEAKRAWWCLYAFEKILAFETGRQTTIVDRYLSTIKPQSEKERKAMTEPSASIHIHKEDSAEYKYALISLVNILGEMTKRSSQCWGLDELKACRRDAAIARIFDTAGEIDSMLMDWQHFQRANFLRNSITCSSPAKTNQNNFLSYYYFQSIITLCRNVFLIEKSKLQHEINRCGANKFWYTRLNNGRAVCLEAVREMIDIFVSLADDKLNSYLSISSSPLAATYVLAIHICQEPGSLLSRSHFELMKAAMELSRGQYLLHRGDEYLKRLLTALEQYVLNSMKCTLSQSSAFELMSYGGDIPDLETDVFDDSFIASVDIPNWGLAFSDWTGVA